MKAFLDENFLLETAAAERLFHEYAADMPIFDYHCHLELKNPFGITSTLLSPATADAIYEQCSEMLQRDDFSTRGLLQKMRVRVVCTTDDPLDSLEHHKATDGLKL